MSNTGKKEVTGKKADYKKEVMTYFKGVKSEWGKITWPERKQAFYETIVVLGVVTFFTVLVYVVDIAFCFMLHPNSICIHCIHPGDRDKCSK